MAHSVHKGSFYCDYCDVKMKNAVFCFRFVGAVVAARKNA